MFADAGSGRAAGSMSENYDPPNTPPNTPVIQLNHSNMDKLTQLLTELPASESASTKSQGNSPQKEVEAYKTRSEDITLETEKKLVFATPGDLIKFAKWAMGGASSDICNVYQPVASPPGSDEIKSDRAAVPASEDGIWNQFKTTLDTYETNSSLILNVLLLTDHLAGTKSSIQAKR